MKIDLLLTIFITLVIGIFIGVFIGQWISGRPNSSPAGGAPSTPFQSTKQTQIPGQTQPPKGPTPAQLADYQATAQSNPSDRVAWLRLANALHDANKPGQAIDAYDKVLALDPNDADVLTDQGVMFRRLQQFDKALANFQRASSLDPSHSISVFNQGIVYQLDLRQPQKAREAWGRYLVLDPDGPRSLEARQFLAR